MNLVEGHKEHYIKVSCGGVEGWVRMTRVSSLSSRYNRCKVKQFGFHFDIGFVDPSPATSSCRRKGQFAFQSKVMEIIM
jgi:hypothetical protein